MGDIGGGGMSVNSPAGLSVFQLDEEGAAARNEALELARVEEEEQREEEERVQHQIDENLKTAFDDISLNLEEDDGGDHYEQATEGEEVVLNTPNGGGGDLPAHFLTSTPYHRGEEEKEVSHQQLEILYMARGHEIERMKAEIAQLGSTSSTDHRSLMHQSALLQAENERMRVENEQLKDSNRATMEDNSQLRQELESLKRGSYENEKIRAELIARSEDSDQFIKALQTQLSDLQGKDTLLRAREQNDALLRSVRERHEREAAQLQQEVDRLSAGKRRADTEVANLKEKMAENQLHYEAQMMQKSEQHEELSQRLHDSQKRLSELIVASAGHHDTLGDPMKEICDLKIALHSVKEERNEQRRIIHDLKDENGELQTQLSTLQNKTPQKLPGDEDELEELRANLKTSREDAHTLRRELDRKAAKIVELGVREQELNRQHHVIKSEVHKLRSIVSANSANATHERSAENMREDELDLLRSEVNDKESLLRQQEVRIQDLICQWEQEKERIRTSHCRDRDDLSAMKAKYTDLKKKVRSYQKHSREKEAHYKEQLEEQTDKFERILLSYKDKMEEAYSSKERQITDELTGLKHHFDEELRKLASRSNTAFKPMDSGPTSLVKDTPPFLSLGSDEENHRPPTSASSSSRPGLSASEQMARLCEGAARDARSQLKRPPFADGNNRWRAEDANAC